MPPKCCTPDCIPLKHVNDLFNDDFKRLWNRKFAEFSNRDRITCPSRRCDQMIRPSQIRHHRNGRSSARCSCGTKVCCSCYGKWHESKQCPVDEGTSQFLQTAKEKGWKPCYKCHHMVELVEGCNHMTCRCGAQFCMICGSKWRTCECPFFNYDHLSDIDDEFDHVDIPMPMVDRDSDGLLRGRPGGGRVRVRPRRGSYDEVLLSKPFQPYRTVDPERRRHHVDYDEEEDDDEDDYLGDMGEVVGLGNAALHHMNSDYRRSQNAIAQPGPPPVAPPPPSATFERGSSGTNYVSGVNKARGVRASSMERRLADRFSDQRQGPGAAFRSFGHGIPPPPPPQAMGPPSPQLPMTPSPISRRHTMDDDMYDSPRNPLLPSHPMLRRTATRDYADDYSAPMQTGRRRQRNMESSVQSSELAGLSGPGSGMHRVDEWRAHVRAH
ncbi:hypothetical protein F5Y18DRAFT_417933 [Xylariaceae sp. FL1019]|nr:hypothetical protein F5Y18DRAFT_417933 [Xylariaceae sp. FL1019]